MFFSEHSVQRLSHSLAVSDRTIHTHRAFCSQIPDRGCGVTTLGKLFTPTCLCRCKWFSDWLRCERPRPVMFITIATAMYSLGGHGLRTLHAVPRSTQPSTLRGTIKWVSVFGLSNNNKWRWWMWMVQPFIGGLTVQVGWLGLRVGGHPALSLHSSNEPGELSQWPWSWGQHYKRCRWIIIITAHLVVISWMNRMTMTQIQQNYWRF